MSVISCTCGATYDDTRLTCPTCRRPRPMVGDVGRGGTTSRSVSGSDDALATSDPLPTELRDAWRIVGRLEVDAVQADLHLVAAADAPDDTPTHVLKRYRRDASGDGPERGRTLARLRDVAHPGVVRIEDHDPDGRWELAEYVAGGTLADLIAERRASGGRFDEEETRTVVRALADAVSAVHRVGVFHRDLKPSNVLVRSRDPLDLTLTDFGGAVGTDMSVVLEDVGVATPRYAPPEWFNATSRATGDVWPIGVIAIELLTEHPFDGLEPVQVQARLGRRPSPIEPDALDGAVDGEGAGRWRRLLEGTLHPDPEERWSAREVLAWADGEDVPAPAHPGVTAGGEDVRRPTGGATLLVADRPVVEPREVAAAIVSTPATWAEGRELLRSGRLRIWAREQLPELLPLLDPNVDADVLLTEVVLTIDPLLTPNLLGEDVSVGRLPRLVTRAVQGDDPAATAATEALLDDDGPAAVLTRLGRGPEHEALAELMERRRSAEQELADAWRDLGALPDLPQLDLPQEMRLFLLGRLVAPGTPLGRSATQLAILRRAPETRRVLRRSRGAVRDILLDQIPPLSTEELLDLPADSVLSERGVPLQLAMAFARDVSTVLLSPFLVARSWWRGEAPDGARVMRLARGGALPSLALWALVSSTLLARGSAAISVLGDVVVFGYLGVLLAVVLGLVTWGFGRDAGAMTGLAATGLALLLALPALPTGLNAVRVFDPTSFWSTFDASGLTLALLTVLLLPASMLLVRARPAFVLAHRVSIVAASIILGVLLSDGTGEIVRFVADVLFIPSPALPPVPLAAFALLVLALAAGYGNVVRWRRRVVPDPGGWPSWRGPARDDGWAGRLARYLAWAFLLVVVPTVIGTAITGVEFLVGVGRSAVGFGPGELSILGLGLLMWLGSRNRSSGRMDPEIDEVALEPRVASVVLLLPGVGFVLSTIVQVAT